MKTKIKIPVIFGELYRRAGGATCYRIPAYEEDFHSFENMEVEIEIEILKETGSEGIFAGSTYGYLRAQVSDEGISALERIGGFYKKSLVDAVCDWVAGHQQDLVKGFSLEDFTEEGPVREDAAPEATSTDAAEDDLWVIRNPEAVYSGDLRAALNNAAAVASSDPGDVRWARKVLGL